MWIWTKILEYIKDLVTIVGGLATIYTAYRSKENKKWLGLTVVLASVVIILAVFGDNGVKNENVEATPTITMEPTAPPTPTIPATPTPTATNTPTPTNTPTLTNTPTPTVHVHDYTWNVLITKEPTCTSVGIKKNVCECNAYREETIPALGHAYDNESDAYCNNCNEYRATWHYHEQVGSSVYGDWELYKTDAKENTKTETVTTYVYRVYYWVSESGDYRATASRLVPKDYSFNKYLQGTEKSNYGGVTSGNDTYITRVSNGKYNILESEVFYSSQGYVSENGCKIDGVNYWEEVIGSEERKVTYTEYHYFFRKFY